MNKKLFALFLACALFVLTACGSGKDSPAEPTQEPTQEPIEIIIDDEGQTTVADLVGLYQADRASMRVEAEGADKAKLTVLWGSSAWESTEWVMSGKLDPKTNTVEYDDCVRTDRVYSQEGSQYTDTVVYRNGKGRVVFNTGNKSLTWEDDLEHVADGKLFTFVPTGGEPAETDADPNHYAAVTILSKEKVESIAADVRNAYLHGNWAPVADMVRYPITVDGTELKDKDAFLRFMKNATIAEEDKKSMEDETCKDMFVNGQGICMGSGQVWLNDPSYMTDKEPSLVIIALSGIKGKAETATSPTPAPTPATESKLPKVTKSPTDETVEEGGSCWFVAKYENAVWAEWHFVSPDGKTDLDYDKITTKFPDLVVVEGYASTTRLKNIPLAMDGWKVYCRFSNNYGSVVTASAKINVKEKGTLPPQPTGAPKVTKNPTSETVEPGGSCWFVAKYENAIWAEWHFVSPDGKTDLKYDKINTQFANLKVVDGNVSTMLLKNIPAEMHGWKVYCRFSNDEGHTDTTMATISIKGAAADRYVGAYVCDRATIRISGDAQLYQVRITWGSSATEHSEWILSGKFDENGVLSYTDCSRTDLVYTDDVTHTDTVIYTGGTGKLEYKDGVIIWTDNVQNVADGMRFVRNDQA